MHTTSKQTHSNIVEKNNCSDTTTKLFRCQSTARIRPEYTSLFGMVD